MITPPFELALDVPLLVGEEDHNLSLGIAAPGVEKVVNDGSRLEVDHEGHLLRFEVLPGSTIYLSSDGLTSFSEPPTQPAFPIEPDAPIRLLLDAEVEGDGRAILWLIQYGQGDRLGHVRSEITKSGGAVYLLTAPEAETARVAVQVSGGGRLTMRGATLERLEAPVGVPPALGVGDGAFVAIGVARSEPEGRLPAACPDQLPLQESVSVATPGAARDGRSVRVFLTVDTEDAYFTEPRLMTGAGVGREYGVFGILDLLEARSLTATFFVNVFEAWRQPKDSVRAVVREIADRGHEVGLHTHPAPELPWYDKPLFRNTGSEQREILARGRALLQDWSGQPVISFRAGGYAINDETLHAASEVGLLIDSSIYFPSPNNRNAKVTVNAPRMIGGLIESPVTYVIRTDPWGHSLEHRKLDLDWLTPNELSTAIEQLRAEGAGAAVFMMHSFSFIHKASRRPEQPHMPGAVFTSPVLFNRYVEVYGPNPPKRAAFETFLDRLIKSPAVDAGPLCAAQEELRELALHQPRNVVPVVVRD